MKFDVQEAAIIAGALVEVVNGRPDGAEKLITGGQDETRAEELALLGRQLCVDEQLGAVGIDANELVEMDFWSEAGS